MFGPEIEIVYQVSQILKLKITRTIEMIDLCLMVSIIGFLYISQAQGVVG